VPKHDSTARAGSILLIPRAGCEEASFIEALRRRDLEAERRLVQQLREDFRNVDRSPRGLLLLQRAFRGSIVGWLQRDLLRGDLQTAEEAWNDALFRVWSRIEQYDEDRSRFLTWVWSQASWAALDLKRKPEARRDIPYAGEERAAEPKGGDEGIDLLARSLEEEAARWVDEPEPATRFEERAIKRALDRVTKTEQPPPIRCVVPRVLGLRLAVAKRKIRQRHCSVGRVRHARSKRVGRVISQRPHPGTVKRRGYPIVLIVGRR
jgi:DNA-directed RNA polymerase specialized sigma24 family protein